MNTAEQIIEQFGSDGQNWENDNGAHLDDVCAEAGSTVIWRDGYRSGDVYKHMFIDGSVITCSGAAYDLGYRDCWCWQGVGHTEDCTRYIAIRIFEDTGGYHFCDDTTDYLDTRGMAYPTSKAATKAAHEWAESHGYEMKKTLVEEGARL